MSLPNTLTILYYILLLTMKGVGSPSSSLIVTVACSGLTVRRGRVPASRAKNCSSSSTTLSSLVSTSTQSSPLVGINVSVVVVGKKSVVPETQSAS